jgi:hypothetical protein
MGGAETQGVREAAPRSDPGQRKVAMSTPEDPTHVRPALLRAEVELAHHLDEACEERGVDLSEESTDELLRLEEELLAAARAVEEAVKLRRQLDDAKEGAAKRVADPQPPPTEPSGVVRHFRTSSGSEWRVWEVRPGASGRPRKLELYPGDYAQGWLAFELLNGERRKRLPKFAPNWATATDADLERLLEQAVEVSKRKERPAVPMSTASEKWPAADA